mgnify:CR=1 FL=1
MNPRSNNLYTKEECPECHFVFISGYNNNGNRTCPSCKKNFVTGELANHGSWCSICATRKRGANNVYYGDGCPAIMSDGRFITYYNSTNELTEAMRKLNGFTSPNEFRNFMQKYGHQFLDAERKHILQQNTCLPKSSCSEGWYKLWTQNQGNWANNNQEPVAYNQ